MAKKGNPNTRTRNYKEIYRKYHSSKARRRYRSKLSSARRKAGRRAKGKDMVHKNGRIVGAGNRLANRRDGQRKSVRSRMRKKRR